ncbi:MAG: hypothetical protein KC656_03975 [Myxococcales bacterium]|nr:hypothetical protein [Myxococcales bacterium]MCB9668868.1 hypothetical protein [Alphaproteobacteria bacterium]MCB9691194.1 hypothetical protein [Alphaproteobacteria bacterium]
MHTLDDSEYDQGDETGIYSTTTLWAFFWACCVASGALAWATVPGWSLFQIVAAGLIGGALGFIMMFVNHLIVLPADA